jgi:non-specific serine/threonine protein kinase
MLAWLQGGTATLAAARELFEEAVGVARPLNDRRLIAEAVGGLARTARDQGDYAIADALLNETLGLAQANGDRYLEGQSLDALGVLAMRLGDFAQALDCFQHSMACSREAGDEVGVAVVLGNLGLLAYGRDDLDAAIDFAGQSLAMGRDLSVRWILPDDLEVCAGVAARCGRPERAARLYGAADALQELWGKASILTRHHDLELAHRRDIARTRLQLGEVAFAAAATAGRQLTLDESVSEALAIREAVSANSGAGKVGALTRRESEVARLVARGLTNSQIASELVVSEATAARHVEHILGKLGFTSRVQIAAWVIAVPSQ